jgi:predicted transposase/invertase (TIGR01784 family)
MAEFLKLHGSEVENMLYSEWDWEEAEKVWREEARAEGAEEKSTQIARNMLAKGMESADIAEVTGLPPEKISEIVKTFTQCHPGQVGNDECAPF